MRDRILCLMPDQPITALCLCFWEKRDQLLVIAHKRVMQNADTGARAHSHDLRLSTGNLNLRGPAWPERFVKLKLGRVNQIVHISDKLMVS